MTSKVCVVRSHTRSVESVNVVLQYFKFVAASRYELALTWRSNVSVLWEIEGSTFSFLPSKGQAVKLV